MVGLLSNFLFFLLGGVFGVAIMCIVQIAAQTDREFQTTQKQKSSVNSKKD
ncbi:DUF3789 domain-containing protein [Enterococcus faecium]|uniref:DUF3789 domain-containing protein n=1 Tax=Enterococcus TaxID=1350 RepID=UPI0009F59071|nr:DUF3789 domain-containing protein [Enterococcus sp. HMSC072F02]MDB7281299.1 DUF3789 domain-containing protein [Enterococcus faecium]MDB7283914.1 DUF3789 domain-containing protein [Enterococcus faecium]MDB7289021.1 DUF3789 domain-containing protein [Enterococcus faecium]MDB7294106.1 DUF3789 domain-containing protein [Enterococcus faecium]MDB7304101.1 DUF3789 domain-containing protein [Enterococcus faecium]